jgi:RNA polymerase sigma factor (sigma-70 family)
VSDNLNKLVRDAQQGDQDALEEVVRRIQDRVHHLAMRMLVNPEDAFEATQEILILIITKLSTFRGDSAFHTWVYRVAANYLLGAKKILGRDHGLNFEMFRADLESGLLAAPDPPADDMVMLNELRISCTMAMLLCLDLKHRIAYVLGDILELDHGEAAGVLGISKANYRKRLSRGRGEVVAFTSRNCGLANAAAKCTCPRRLPAAMAAGRVRPDNITYALKDAPAYGDVSAKVKEVEGALRTMKLQTATPQFKSPKDLGARIAQIVRGST